MCHSDFKQVQTTACKRQNQTDALLTFTTLSTNSADDKLVTFFLYFPDNRIRYFMQIVSRRQIGDIFSPENRIWHFNGDNLHKMSKPGFWAI